MYQNTLSKNMIFFKRPKRILEVFVYLLDTISIIIRSVTKIISPPSFW